MRPVRFETILRRFHRVAIVGGPRVGKTTLALKVRDRPVIASDDIKHLEWSEQPARMIHLVGARPSFVVEGVQVARALRRGLEVDAVVVLTVPRVKRRPGQKAMAKAVLTILHDWRTAHRRVPMYTTREGSLAMEFVRFTSLARMAKKDPDAEKEPEPIADQVAPMIETARIGR